MAKATLKESQCLCKGTGTHQGRMCPQCDGKGSIVKMLKEPPEFNPQAKIVRIIQEPGLQPVLVMDDGTFRIYHPNESPKDPGRKHFAVGLTKDKTDGEIRSSAAYLLSGSGVQFFHEDGTPHE